MMRRLAITTALLNYLLLFALFIANNKDRTTAYGFTSTNLRKTVVPSTRTSHAIIIGQKRHRPIIIRLLTPRHYHEQRSRVFTTVRNNRHQPSSAIFAATSSKVVSSNNKFRRRRRGGGIPLLFLPPPGQRLVAVISVVVGAFFTYIAGTAILNRTIVERYGVSRRGDAFGPFVTLLSLIYSIVLGQIYHYYFERQQVIQNCLYEEAVALQLLFHACCRNRTEKKLIAAHEAKVGAADDNNRLLLASLKTYTQKFIATAFCKTSSRILSHEDPGELMDLAHAFDVDSNKRNDGGACCSSIAVAGAVQAATSARALRVSHVNSELPGVQKITARLLSYVILLGFVLVDLEAPILEAWLFAVICGCFTTIHVFLADLSDPFSGQWSVGTHIRKDLDDLMLMMSER